MPTSRSIKVYFHGDTDGCCCAALLCDCLEREGTAFELHPLEADGVGDIVGDVFLDLGAVTKKNVRPDTLVVDHHPQEALPCRHFNPRLRGKNWPASYECFLQFGRDETCWIAAAGCIGDSQPNASLEECARKRFGVLDLQKAAFMIEAFRSCNGTASMGLVVEKVLAYREKPNGFCSDAELLGVYEKVEVEIQKMLKTDVQVAGKMVWMDFTSKYSIKSQLANILQKKHPDRVVVIAQKSEDGYRLSFRQKEDVVDLHGVLAKTMDGLKTAKWGGHPKASGATLSAEDFPKFYRRLKDGLR